MQFRLKAPKCIVSGRCYYYLFPFTPFIKPKSFKELQVPKFTRRYRSPNAQDRMSSEVEGAAWLLKGDFLNTPVLHQNSPLLPANLLVTFFFSSSAVVGFVSGL